MSEPRERAKAKTRNLAEPKPEHLIERRSLEELEKNIAEHIILYPSSFIVNIIIIIIITTTQISPSINHPRAKIMSLIVVAFLTLLVSISSFGTRADAKPLSPYQVSFRRVPPKDFPAALGSSITIECEAGASPPPTIHWLKNGVRIMQDESSDNRYDEGLAMVDDVNRIALSSTQSRLFIDCAQYDDEAVYTCVAENPVSRIATSTKLNLVKPITPVASDNELDSEVSEFELQQLQSDKTNNNSNQLKQQVGDFDSDKKSELSAVSQCLNERNLRINQIQPVRIHMWTHNILEIQNNDVILYCRSNAKGTQSTTSVASSHNHISSPLKPQLRSAQEEEDISTQQEDKRPEASITWILPGLKQVSSELKDKYEILETGDLLIKDLRWTDKGKYICTVSDDQGSDSVSSYVYPAAASKKH